METDKVVFGFTDAGTPLYAIAGGSGEGGGDGGAGGGGGDGGSGGGGEGGEGGKGEGGEEKAPEERLAELEADRDKWKSQARKHEKRSKDNADAAERLKAIEDEKKSETEKAAERSANAEKAATEAQLETLRLRVALRKGLSETQAKRLVGTTEEELEADADELVKSFTKDDDGDGSDKGKSNGRPKEKLKSGSTQGGDDSDPADYREHAKKLPRF